MLVKVLETSTIVSVELLGIGVFDAEEGEDCATMGIVSRAKGKKNNVGIMRAMRKNVEMLVSMCYAVSAYN